MISEQELEEIKKVAGFRKNKEIARLVEAGYQRCWRCNTVKPLISDNWFRNKNRKCGYSNSCKNCQSEISAQYHRKTKIVKPKTCRTCGVLITDKSRTGCFFYCSGHRGQAKKQYQNKKMRHRVQLRERLFKILGDKCVRCGFTDRRALQVDHKSGDGAAERRLFGTYWEKWYVYALQHLYKYQLLCANCNWIKRFENKEGHVGDFYKSCEINKLEPAVTNPSIINDVEGVSLTPSGEV